MNLKSRSSAVGNALKKITFIYCRHNMNQTVEKYELSTILK